MSEAWKNLVYYKLAIWKLSYGAFAVLVGAIPATLMNWYVMNAIEKTIAISGLTLTVLKFVDGFIDQTASRLIAGKPPVSLGDTQFLKKVPEQVTVVTKG